MGIGPRRGECGCVGVSRGVTMSHTMDAFAFARAVLVVLALAGAAHAQAVVVAADGTGDHTQIQPAIDAAS